MMQEENKLLDELMANQRIRNLGLKREAISDILNLYNDIFLKVLLDNGYSAVGNGMTIEIIPLVDRVHVLRGVKYKSSRKYKLKMYMDEHIYEQIEDYYDKLRENIS